MTYLDHHAVWNDAVFWDYNDSVTDVVMRMVDLVRFAGWGNNYVVAYSSVFIDDGIFDPAVCPYTDPRLARLFVLLDGLSRFVVVAPQQNRAIQHRPRAYKASEAYDAVANRRPVDNT